MSFLSKKIFSLSSLVVLFCASTAMADEAAGFSPLVFAGITNGGDDLAKIKYENGDSAKISAGELLMLGGGVNYQFAESPINVQAAISYFFDNQDAKNGDATFERWPVDLLGFYNAGNHRFGAGLSYHMNPEFDASLDGYDSINVDFDNALGAVVEYGYKFSGGFVLGLRYTSIDYSSSKVDGDIDGSNVGLMATFTF